MGDAAAADMGFGHWAGAGNDDAVRALVRIKHKLQVPGPGLKLLADRVWIVYHVS